MDRIRPRLEWSEALGAALLFAANLLGILSGTLVTLAVSQPDLRVRLWRSRLGLVSLLLKALLLIPLSGSFLSLMAQARRAATLEQIQQAIAASLKNRTLTLGKDSELINVRVEWNQNPPLIRAAVRLTNPRLPTARQVADVQAYINQQQPIRYRLIVQRVSVDVIGPETEPNPVQSRPQVVHEDPASSAPIINELTSPALPLPESMPSESGFGERCFFSTSCVTEIFHSSGLQ